MQSVNSVRTGVMGRELSCAVDAMDRSRASSDASDPGASPNARVSGQIWTFAVVRPHAWMKTGNPRPGGLTSRRAGSAGHRAGSWPRREPAAARRAYALLYNNTGANPLRQCPLGDRL